MNSQLDVINKTGHMPHEEQYEEVDKLIINFFKKNESTYKRTTF